MAQSAARWRYLRTSFWWWFGLIWSFVGTTFAIVGAAALARGGADWADSGSGSSSWWTLPLVFACIGLVLGGIGLALVLRTLGACQRHLALLSEGLAAIGAVTAVEENLRVRINNRHPRFLRYQFTDAAGQTHGGRSPYLPRKLEDRFTPGDSLVVLYDPSDPTRNTVDLFGERAASGVAAGAS
jgi:hypothetical protein